MSFMRWLDAEQSREIDPVLDCLTYLARQADRLGRGGGSGRRSGERVRARLRGREPGRAQGLVELLVALGHLAPEKRGLLGPPSPKRLQDVRSLLAQAFGKNQG